MHRITVQQLLVKAVGEVFMVVTLETGQRLQCSFILMYAWFEMVNAQSDEALCLMLALLAVGPC